MSVVFMANYSFHGMRHLHRQRDSLGDDNFENLKISESPLMSPRGGVNRRF
jgi:hypothetical protein